MSKKPVKRVTVVCTAVTAVIWTLNCVLICFVKERNTALVCLDFLCALIWWLAFAANLRRWRGQRFDE